MEEEIRMNRKGFGIPSIGMVFVLVLVIFVLASINNGVDTSSIDKAIETLNWSKYNTNVSSSIDNAVIDSPYYVKTIMEICKKALDFMGYSIFAVAKLAMEFAKNNPSLNLEVNSFASIFFPDLSFHIFVLIV